MIVSLPFDVLLDIFFHLQARDILNIRSTCKALFVATEDRSVWVQTLSALPLPYTALRLSSMSLDQLMRCAVTSARLDETWRRQHFTPKTIRYEPSDVSLIHARLLPGGEWIVSLSLGLVGGEVHLQRWDSDSSSARIDCPPGYFTGTAHITCKTFLLSKHENLILYYNAYQITLFRSNTAIPSLKSLQTISSTTPFVSVSAADGMLAYHTLDHEGRDAVCIRTVGPEDTVFQSIMAPAGRARTTAPCA
ncbi:hypothetical protein JAAARDRAFT_574212 [Jaapia argillacea MUCL 33604]|uniref:F-box domain-containing protein n=1 Tax=Jaapia argillacea MUCL 33604 TaxID=933084 RepID=A0A067Q2G3_9AGAM|nr:hypothetical protein JAAARDRAFT_574212 [Jaapia argillacea MUCL 33604]